MASLLLHQGVSSLTSGWPFISHIRVCLISLIRVAFHLSHQGGLSSLTSGCLISLIWVASHLSHQGVSDHLSHQGGLSSLTSGWPLIFHIRVCLIISFIRAASQLSRHGVSHLSHQGGLSSLSPGGLSSLSSEWTLISLIWVVSHWRFHYNSYENLLRTVTNEESVKPPFEGGCFVTTRLPDMTSSVDWGYSHESHMTTAHWVCPDAANNATVATVNHFGLIS